VKRASLGRVWVSRNRGGGVKLQYRARRLGRYLALAALVGVGSRGDTWPLLHWWALVHGAIPGPCSTGGRWFTERNWKNHSSVRAECRKHPKILPPENSSSMMFCYFRVSGVITISLDRDVFQPLIELQKKEQRFEWV